MIKLQRVRPAAGCSHIIAAANESADRTGVRTLWILAPGTVPVPEPADTDPASAAAGAGPTRTRETASDGYHRAPGGDACSW
ncbi:hypothetical protein ACWEQ7_36820 [Streptomyces sp. NPDC004069]